METVAFMLILSNYFIMCYAEYIKGKLMCLNFLDSMGGGAWPFLVGGVICLDNSINERDLNLLTSPAVPER